MTAVSIDEKRQYQSKSSELPKSVTAPESRAFELIPVSHDGGYGYTKTYLRMQGIECIQIVDSYLVKNPTTHAIGSKEGLVTFCEGSDRLAGTSWIAGERANLLNRNDHPLIRVCDGSKPELTLQLMLCNVAEFLAEEQLTHKIEPLLRFVLTVSIHDVKTYGAEMKKALEGAYSVELNGRRFQIHIRVAGVVPEGTGAILHAASTKKLKAHELSKVFNLDFGNQTLICSMFKGAQLLGSPVYRDRAGVNALIERIAQHPKVIRFCNGQADRHLVREAIEHRDLRFEYGREVMGEFRSVYAECLAAWLETTVIPFLKEPEIRRLMKGAKFLAIGGGALLQGLTDKLKEYGFTVLEDAQTANVKGMFAYSVSKMEG